MPDLSDFTDLASKGAAKGQDLAAKGQDLVSKAVDAVRTNSAVERALDFVPTRGEVVDSVTATANELLSLRQDVQSKVLTALKWNV